MADSLSKQARSERMAKILGTNTKPELIVRKFLFGQGFRYRIHNKRLPGNPDIVLKKHGVVIYINGCFWHGHEDCKTWRIPLSKQEFWIEKITKNKERDRRNMAKIKGLGFRPIVVWECELRNKALRQDRLTRLLEEVKG